MFISDYLAAQKSCWLCKMSFVRLNFANHDNGGQWLVMVTMKEFLTTSFLESLAPSNKSYHVTSSHRSCSFNKKTLLLLRQFKTDRTGGTYQHLMLNSFTVLKSYTDMHCIHNTSMMHT